MKPTHEELEQKLAESERYGRQADITIENLERKVEQLAAENAGLKSKLIFWDWDDPETSYDSPEELAEAFSLNYNEEFTVMVAAKMPNRVYRVCESWDQECKVELVEGGGIVTPATDRFIADVKAQARNELIDELESRFTELSKTLEPQELRGGAAGAAAFVSAFRKGAAK